MMKNLESQSASFSGRGLSPVLLGIEVIQSAVERIVAAARPSKVILFGSYARGDADEGSDIDLLVVEPKVENRGEEMVKLRLAVGWIGRGVDILVCSEEDCEKRGSVPGTVIYWALREGKVLHDARS
jgi:predicted nucleotidyltransferase